MNKQKTLAGMVWYRREEYETVLAIMEDAIKLPRTYASWLAQAEANEKIAHQRGFSTIRAFIDPKTFPAWCHARGYKINAQARNEFANFAAKEAARNI